MHTENIFASIPSVDTLLNHPKMLPFIAEYSHEFVKKVLHNVIARTRVELEKNPQMIGGKQETEAKILDACIDEIRRQFRPSLKRVINATGIVLHTGLGRAPFSKTVQENITNVLEGYSNIELDLESGKRGQRNEHVARLLTQLTGAESAVVVNNNAAAVFLALNTMAFGKEAVISRGQLIEIGGSFRIPDVMEKSGAIMREVGTTNKTRLSDYKNAITENTGVIVVAHTSNYRVLGFTQEVELAELVQLAHEHGIPVLHDLGGGVLVDLQQYGLPYEPLVQDSVKAGVDVITFSGDKIIGGPQSGIMVGKKEWIGRIHTNPIMRAVRCDKLIYSALESTLKLFFSEKKLLQQHKTLGMLAEPAKDVRLRAKRVLDLIDKKIIEQYHIAIETAASQAGSGALPLAEIPSYALVLGDMESAEQIAHKLRTSDPPVVGYIKNGLLYLDIRTVSQDEVEVLAGVVNRMERE